MVKIMKIEKLIYNDVQIVHVISEEVLITDTQSATDLMMTVAYETGIKNIVMAKELFAEKFFVLSSGLAEEVLQKFVNYRFRLAVYGDYSKYTSKPLKDFIYESNNGRDVFFMSGLKEEVEKIGSL